MSDYIGLDTGPWECDLVPQSIHEMGIRNERYKCIRDVWLKNPTNLVATGCAESEIGSCALTFGNECVCRSCSPLTLFLPEDRQRLKLAFTRRGLRTVALSLPNAMTLNTVSSSCCGDPQ